MRGQPVGKPGLADKASLSIRPVETVLQLTLFVEHNNIASLQLPGQAAGDPDTGETYYQHWLATLEHLVAAKGVTTHETLHRYRDAWDHAADRTPHGQPIVLTAADFG